MELRRFQIGSAFDLVQEFVRHTFLVGVFDDRVQRQSSELRKLLRRVGGRKVLLNPRLQFGPSLKSLPQRIEWLGQLGSRSCQSQRSRHGQAVLGGVPSALAARVQICPELLFEFSGLRAASEEKLLVTKKGILIAPPLLWAVHCGGGHLLVTQIGPRFPFFAEKFK